VAPAQRRRDDLWNDAVPAEAVGEDDDAQALPRKSDDVAVEAAAVVSPVPERGAVLGLLYSPAQAPADLPRETPGRLC
jgi:hypothetical protein